MASCQAHNLEIAGSNPAPAITSKKPPHLFLTRYGRAAVCACTCFQPPSLVLIPRPVAACLSLFSALPSDPGGVATNRLRA